MTVDPQPVKLAEAAERLGITPEAVRLRIHAGSLDGYKDQRGHWFVLLSKETKDSSKDDAALATIEPPGQLILEHFLEHLEDRDRAAGARHAELVAIIEAQSQRLEQLEQHLAQRERGQDARDQWVVQQLRAAMTDAASRRPWWQRWLSFIKGGNA